MILGVEANARPMMRLYVRTVEDVPDDDDGADDDADDDRVKDAPVV